MPVKTSLYTGRIVSTSLLLGCESENRRGEARATDSRDFLQVGRLHEVQHDLSVQRCRFKLVAREPSKHNVGRLEVDLERFRTVRHGGGERGRTSEGDSVSERGYCLLLLERDLLVHCFGPKSVRCNTECGFPECGGPSRGAR